MNADCNTGIKKNGKLCPCRLGLGHLGQHEYKERDNKDDISTEGCLIGLVACTGIIALFIYSVTERWGEDPYFFFAGLGLVILTVFGFVGWLVFFGTLIRNLYWSRKPDEIWVRNKDATEYAKIYGEDWIKLEDKNGVPKVN